MNLHEYQAKQLLQKYGIPVAPFQIIEGVDQLDEAIVALGTEELVLKVQVHAGGRGKAGGVKLVKGRTEAKEKAQSLLGMHIVNAQTGKQGVIVKKLLMTPLCHYQQEYYLGAAIDRKNACSVLIASPQGGMEIEEIAQQNKEAILQIPIPLDGQLHSYQLWELATFMGWSGKLREAGMSLASQLALAFTELDASLIEINPLVTLSDSSLEPSKTNLNQ